MACSNLILGGGVSGLAAGLTTGWPIFEAEDTPGGICSSYYAQPGNKERLKQTLSNRVTYRFEIGGGHWIFGGNNEALSFIRKFTPFKNYTRRSSVYFSKENLYVPYPLQNNLRFLKKEVANKALEEMSNKSKSSSSTMKGWLLENFGSTLCNLFFYPFHKLYTANLYEHIAPQDVYKTPIDISLVIQGARREVPPVGYNVTFVYPEEGLNTLAQRIADGCNIHYGKRAIKINVKNKEVYFADGSAVSYRTLISTLPLNKMIKMTGLKVDAEPDPYISVLVLNIGAKRGKSCSNEHWLYIPDSTSGFYRVGFYSNINASFLPKSSQKDDNQVSIYVERAYRGGMKPSEQEIKTFADLAVKELQEWDFIREVEVIDPTWIDVAYTWSWPGSRWREQTLQVLKKHNIYQISRYGCWKFQGIADSIRDGLLSQPSR